MLLKPRESDCDAVSLESGDKSLMVLKSRESDWSAVSPASGVRSLMLLKKELAMSVW